MTMLPGWAIAQNTDDTASATASPAVAPRGSAASWSADLPVVSDGRHVWLWADAVDEKDSDRRLTSLYHADATERPPDGPVWEPVTDFTGRLAPRGAAADGDSLWLIFDDGQVSSLALRPAPLEGDWYFGQQAGKSLPAHTTVRASVAAHGKLWVLARVETGQAIADLDRGESAKPGPVATSADEADLMNLVLGLPRELPINSDDPLGQNTSAEAEEAPASDPGDEANREGEGEADAAARDAKTEADTDTDTDTDTETNTDVEAEMADADQAATEHIAAAIEDDEPLPAVPADRLLVLDRGAWRVVGLPAEWESNRPTQLIAPRTSDISPTLLVSGGKDGDGLSVTLYRPVAPTPSAPDMDAAADNAASPSENSPASPPESSPENSRWTVTALTLPAAGGVVGLRVQDQFVVAQHTPTSAGFAAKLWAVRGDGLTAVGEATLNDTTGTPAHGLWAALPFGDSIGLLAGARDTADAVRKRMKQKSPVGPAPGPSLTAVDLHGDVVLDPVRLDAEPRNPLAESADLLIMLGVVITSTVLLFSFWRRDPTINELQLPEGFVVADLMRRGLAGVIDVVPGLMVATSGFGLPWDELYDRWPGRGLGATWGMMLPGIAAIGVVVGHTLVLEMATGRSLGKWATGLRVMTIGGEPPRPRQAATRCVLKTFDLIAYLLLILPVVSPNRQRLGDMVARTVVVMKSPAMDDADEKKGRDRDESDE